MSSKEMLNDLKKKVEYEKIPKALWLCLNYTETHKQDINTIGAAWVDDNKFILNTFIFSKFINRKIHTINRNLREHSFKTKKIGYSERSHLFSLLNLNPLLERSWCLRDHKDFTRYSEEKIIDQIPYKSIPKKSCQIKISTISKNTQNYNNIKRFVGSGIINNQKTTDKPPKSNCNQITNFFYKNLEDFDTDCDDSFGPLFSDHDQYFL